MAKDTPLSLVKFAKADVARIILATRKLRFSAPHLFPDPFENSAHHSLPFDEYDLMRAIVKAMCTMIFSRDDPRGEQTPVKKAVRRWRSEGRFRNEEEAEESLMALLPTMARQRFERVQELLKKWRNYASNIRILTLTENHTEICNWQLFGDHHQGVALRFKVSNEGCLADPKRVTYRGLRELITTQREQVEIFVGDATENELEDMEQKVLTKSKVDSAQKEWRCIRKAAQPVEADSGEMSVAFDDIPFAPEELIAVYFGAAISDVAKRELIGIITTQYPGCKIYQARTKEADYELLFDRIDGDSTKEIE